MPSTINRLAIQNKTVNVRKSTKIPLSKFNTLDFPKGNFYIEPVITTNESDNQPDNEPDSQPDNEPDQEPEYLSQINKMIYLQTGGEI